MPLRQLGRDDLVTVLTAPKNAIVRQYQYLFSKHGATLEFETGALEAVAEIALERKPVLRAPLGDGRVHDRSVLRPA